MAHGYGKTALITGASSGIGRELACVFAEHGYNLLVVARNACALQTLAEELYDAYGTTATVLPKDLAKASAPQQIFKALQPTASTSTYSSTMPVSARSAISPTRRCHG